MQPDSPATDALVSIITPAHNEAAHIRDTIASVLGQTYRNWELIVADDASTDETADIVADIARTDSRVTLVRVPAPNGLAARARNVAMENARGKFLAFLDADDLWKPEKLATQVAYLDAHTEVDGVCSRYEYIGDSETVSLHEDLASASRSPSLRTDRLCTKSDAIRACPFLTSTVLMRARCFTGIGGMDEDPRLKSGQDYEYFARLVDEFTFHRLPDVLTEYRLQPASASLSTSQRVARNVVGWNIYEVLAEKGYFTEREASEKRAYLYFEQAKNNLFRLDAPYRASVIRSVATMRPPREALVLLLLLWLPRDALTSLLPRLVALRNRVAG